MRGKYVFREREREQVIQREREKNYTKRETTEGDFN